MTIKTTLAFYVDNFKKWRQENYTNEQIAINATDDVSYPNWNEIENFYIHLLDTNQISKLDNEDKVNLIYLFSRGWDHAAFLDELIESRPITSQGNLTDEDFIRLAETAATLTGPEYDDGKSSIAMCFKKFEYLTPEIENVLLKLYQDKNEYTKRQALFALAKLGYKDTVTLVEKSWMVEDEWHKIGCLIVLDEYIGDKALLKEYLNRTVDQGRQDLAKMVQKLKNKNSC